ncbi:MAG: TlpA disulfide reductase family protein [Flavobacteriales bacterium]
MTREQSDVAIVEGLPTIQDLSDSLLAHHISAAKWAVHDGKVIYSRPAAIDWPKELEPIRRSNLNHLRYKDAYDVLDTSIGNERIVRFVAKEATQEIQRVEVKLVSGQIVRYFVERERNNLFSNSSLRFEFTSSHYSLDLKQSIRGFFENHQFVYGSIIPEGSLWRGAFSLKERTVPVQFIANLNGETPMFHVKNGEELIGFNRFEMKGDSMIFGSDYFDSYFILSSNTDTTLNGRWVNAKRDTPVSLNVRAVKNIPYRFAVHEAPTTLLHHQYSAVFYDGKGSPEDSTILKLNQLGHYVSGSFLTETGDYRFLEGVVRKDSLLLSTMDGTHVYYFEAQIKPGALEGQFFAGPSYSQTWRATEEPSAKLADPSTITTLNDSVPFSFSFPDPEGNIVSLSDERFANKPIAVSIMGTWCSNCLDEAVFLKQAYESFHPQGLEIVSLDFELTHDTARALENIKRHRESIGLKYPVLLAGLSTSKLKAQEALSALEEIHSFPTMVILNRKHEVVRIHTGFSGPATGIEVYDEFRAEYFELFKQLVKE